MLYLPQDAPRRLEQMIRAELPHEACGLLIGQRGGYGTEAKQIVQTPNAEPSHPRERFAIAASDLCESYCRARRAGLDIVGVWHAHPEGRACPSETDRADGCRDWAYLIAATDHGRVRELRAWKLLAQGFEEEPLHFGLPPWRWGKDRG